MLDLAETDRSSPVRFSTTQPTQALAKIAPRLKAIRISPGIMVLDDSGEDVHATLYDGEGRTVSSEMLAVRRAAKMSVQR